MAYFFENELLKVFFKALFWLRKITNLFTLYLQTIIRQGAPQQVIQGLPQNIRLASPSPQIITSQQQVVVSTPQQLQPQIVQQSEVPQAVTEIVSQ